MTRYRDRFEEEDCVRTSRPLVTPCDGPRYARGPKYEDGLNSTPGKEVRKAMKMTGRRVLVACWLVVLARLLIVAALLAMLVALIHYAVWIWQYVVLSAAMVAVLGTYLVLALSLRRTWAGTCPPSARHRRRIGISAEGGLRWRNSPR